ncbi:MAG: acyl-CoA mutase large subunit family protein [Betaproteobacteria bacterium]|nr:acyl-CoA mutase large subunit family protein [Betaproteobacteria bacterium]
MKSYSDPIFSEQRRRWENEYAGQITDAQDPLNRSGIAVKPLYTREDWDSTRYDQDLGFPGQPPFGRGIYPTMHRGRTWSQRQLIGLGTPEDYNERLRELLAQGANAISLLPCNSVFRGYDMDEVHEELLGTCGVVVNSWQHLDRALEGVDLARISTGLNDPSPFTLLAFLLAVAKKRGVGPDKLTGTANQSDYISHFAANHMFFRLALPGARRVLTDTIDYTRRNVPKWNPVSVVGQHMQQAGATPAEAMAFALATALQYAEDCSERGMDVDAFLPRFTFFFDVSVSFFEEIAKFRAGRRIWANIARERFGAKDPRSWRFKFHAQTSGADLTREQPLNNIVRVALQAMAGIFGGLQSLHTDSYDEALSCPTAEAARIAVNTQNILREEAHLTGVIDPLGGSYYLESLTNDMQRKIEAIMAEIEAAGGMYRAVELGMVQKRIGASARAFQARVESGEQTVVGVNAYRVEEDAGARRPLDRPDPARMREHVEAFRRWKRSRSLASVQRALDELARAANDPRRNLFEQVVDAAQADCTHGEICSLLRRELGFGDPLIVV